MSGSSDRRAYLQAVIDAYLKLPDTPPIARPADRRLAAQLYHRPIPLSTVKDALLLACSRRLLRPKQAVPLPPVRSLYYFVPIIEELLETPLPKGYARYLKGKIAAFLRDRWQDSRSAGLSSSRGASSKTRTFS